MKKSKSDLQVSNIFIPYSSDTIKVIGSLIVGIVCSDLNDKLNSYDCDVECITEKSYTEEGESDEEVTNIDLTSIEKKHRAEILFDIKNSLSDNGYRISPRLKIKGLK
jgi:hypothetical protein